MSGEPIVVGRMRVLRAIRQFFTHLRPPTAYNREQEYARRRRQIERGIIQVTPENCPAGQLLSYTADLRVTK